MQDFVLRTGQYLRVVHQIPGPIGRFDVAIIMTAIAGEAFVDENRVQRVRNGIFPRAHVRLKIERRRILNEFVDFPSVETTIVVESLEL